MNYFCITYVCPNNLFDNFFADQQFIRSILRVITSRRSDISAQWLSGPGVSLPTLLRRVAGYFGRICGRHGGLVSEAGSAVRQQIFGRLLIASTGQLSGVSVQKMVSYFPYILRTEKVAHFQTA